MHATPADSVGVNAPVTIPQISIPGTNNAGNISIKDLPLSVQEVLF